MEHIRIIVKTHTGEGLGSKIESLFQGVDEYINQRIHQERAQKEHCRQ